jgi:hypothetical protein
VHTENGVMGDPVGNSQVSCSTLPLGLSTSRCRRHRRRFVRAGNKHINLGLEGIENETGRVQQVWREYGGLLEGTTPSIYPRLTVHRKEGSMCCMLHCSEVATQRL